MRRAWGGLRTLEINNAEFSGTCHVVCSYDMAGGSLAAGNPHSALFGPHQGQRPGNQNSANGLVFGDDANRFHSSNSAISGDVFYQLSVLNGEAGRHSWFITI